MSTLVLERRPQLLARSSSVLMFLGRRILQAVFVVWAAFTVSFFILWVLPNDIVSQMLGGGDYVPEEQVEALRERYGLNDPVIVQYLRQLGRMFVGDFGNSVQTGRPVAEALAEAWPHTLGLTSLAMAISLVVGVTTAVVATYVRQPFLRQFLFSLPAIGVAVPGFWIGLMLLWAFSFQLPWFPAMGTSGFSSMVLPAIALSVPTGSQIASILARSLSTEWHAAYVETAEAKGLSRGYIHIRHVLRNSIIPVATVFALTVGALLAGTVIAETIFSRNGIGRLTEMAVSNHDTPMIQAIVVLSAVIYAVANLAVDAMYPLMDPRIRTAIRPPRAEKKKS